MARKAIWYHLAVAFREHIRDDYELVMVAQQKVSGDKFESAYIRVWDYIPEEYKPLVKELDRHYCCDNTSAVIVADSFLDDNVPRAQIRNTILFRDDEISCSSLTHGFYHIDISYPTALEQLLDWMKQCDLVDSDTVLTGQLA